MPVFSRDKHVLTAVRVGQDEVHIVCSACEFLFALALTMRGEYDVQSGKTVQRGDRTHNISRILRDPPPRK